MNGECHHLELVRRGRRYEVEVGQRILDSGGLVGVGHGADEDEKPNNQVEHCCINRKTFCCLVNKNFMSVLR